jgi:stress response protein YsnF
VSVKVINGLDVPKNLTRAANAAVGLINDLVTEVERLMVERDERWESSQNWHAAYHAEHTKLVKTEEALALTVARVKKIEYEVPWTVDGAYERLQADLLRAEEALCLARKVTDAYTAEAEDHNDGEFSLWKADDLVVAIVNLRAALEDE